MTPSVSERSDLRRVLQSALVVSALFLGTSVPAASARDAYVVNEGSGTVSVIETQSNLVVGSPITVGTAPFGLAITPNGDTAFVANFGSGNVSVIDTLTKSVVGAPIAVGLEPLAIAITPDGRFAFVANYASNSVSVIDTQTRQVVGSPIMVGLNPEGIAITPDGRFAYVVNQGSDDVSLIDTQTRQVVGAPIMVGANPEAIAFAPDGLLGYVANEGEESVSLIETPTRAVVGSPIKVGNEPLAVAVAPDGSFAYVANAGDNDVSVIGTDRNQVVGPPIMVGTSPYGIAVSPDGKTAYTANEGSKDVSVIDAQADLALGSPVAVAEDPYEVAITPDQPPIASFTDPRARPGVPVEFNASASSDPDGQVAMYQWDFGEGQAPASGGPTPSHTYVKPGGYQVKLTLTDNEGCSTALVYTGQTAYCNGSSAASQTQALTVAFPGVRAKCPKRSKPQGCAFKLQVVSRKHRGRPESAIARARARAGRSVVISLKPKRKFAAGLAVARTVLVNETVAIAGSKRTLLRKLKVVW